MYSPASGPNGTDAYMAKAMSLPVKKPLTVQAESSEPLEIASKYWLAGTSAPGSKKRASIDPPEIFFTVSTKYCWVGPSRPVVDGKAPATCKRTFLS